MTANNNDHYIAWEEGEKMVYGLQYFCPNNFDFPITKVLTLATGPSDPVNHPEDWTRNPAWSLPSAEWKIICNLGKVRKPALWWLIV